MKVLKDNYKGITKDMAKKQYPKKAICDKCGSELEYEESDITIGWLGAPYIECPCCGYDFMLDDEDGGITLTVDNVEFPTHFNHTSKENAVDCLNNKEIKRYIHNAIDYFRENKDEDENVFAYNTGTGNLTVHVYRYSGDEDYHVVVSGDYYDTYIPFEPEDY